MNNNNDTVQHNIRQLTFIMAILAFALIALTSFVIYDKTYTGSSLTRGPCHTGDTPPCIYHLWEKITVPPNQYLRQNIECEKGDFATGGGYFLNTSTLVDNSLDVEVFANEPIIGSNIGGIGWNIGIRNKTPIRRTGFGQVACFRKRTTWP